MSIDALSGPHKARSAGCEARPHGTRASWLALASAGVCLLLLAAQIASGWHILHSNEFFSALVAHKYVWANAAAAALVAIVAVAAPGRWRWLAVLGPAAYLFVILLATAIPGGAALAMVAAVLTMASLWDTGERMLRRLGANSLARLVPVAWLAGIGPWSLGTVALGHLSLLKWWTIGILLVIVGAIGSVRLGARLVAHRRAVTDELGHSSLSLASAGLILLTCSWAAIYTAAPEIQYDALYGKAYLPEFWARTSEISLNVNHVQDAITGWFQVLATNGHLLGATAVGRYLQLIGLMCTVVTFWWWGHRHGALGPLAAVAVAVTPHLLWQASTADDDLLLALGALALCIAIVESLRNDSGRDVRGLAFALGLMAGSGPSLKLHLVPLFAFLLLGWIAAGSASKSVLRRFTYAAMGAAITGLPPLVLRWIESGNPVLPAYNNIFRSPYWLPINEKLNFPFWAHPGIFGPIEAVWKAVVEPSLMVEDAPPGAFGVLVGTTVLALLLGWLGRDRAARVVWIALIPAAIFWWVSFRYLRYLLPIDFVSVALVLMITSGVTLGPRARLFGVLAATLAAIASFPVAIAQFWNVPTHKPPIYAAIGRWKASSYENAEFNERPAILAFNQLAPRDARAITTAFERVWLKPERDFYNLNYEVTPLMEIHGPVPHPQTGNQAFSDLKRLGIEWALVTGVNGLLNEPGYLSQVLTTHGKIEFAERGWDLYRLVPFPPQPVPIDACDRVTRGIPSCWGGPQKPGANLTVSVTRTVPACSGETIALTVTQAAGGAPSPVLIRFIGANPELGVQPGGTVPGLTQRIFATAPAGTTGAQVIVSPIGGAQITSASIGSLPPGCQSSKGR